MVSVSSQARVLASIAYFRCGRTVAQYGIKAALDSSGNDQRTMNSNRLTVFKAPGF